MMVVITTAFHARVRGSVPGLDSLKEIKRFLPHPRVNLSIVGSWDHCFKGCRQFNNTGREWIVIVDQVQTNYHGRSMVL